MKKNLNVVMKLAIVVALWWSASSVHAVIIQNQNFNNTNQTAFAVSNSDLVDISSTASLSGVTTTGTISGGAASSLNSGTAADIFYADAAYSVTFNLNLDVFTGGSALGYDISSINTFTGWEDERVKQSYSVEYSLVGSASYISLGTFTNSPVTSPGAGNTYSLQLILTDSTGTIVSGVDSIRFNLNPVYIDTYTQNGGSLYREIDIAGVATVPEPSTYVLLGLGVVALLALRPRSLKV
jgi:hypothetical protein